jgi:hypothetical protein
LNIIVETYFDVPDELHYLKTKVYQSYGDFKMLKKKKIGSIFGDYSSFDLDLEGLEVLRKNLRHYMINT